MLFETILGGVTGLLGNVVGGFFKYKTAKENNRHDEKMIELNTKAQIITAKAKLAEIKTTVEGEIDKKDAETAIESQKQGNKSFFDNRWVDNLLQVEGGWKWITFPVGVFIATVFCFIDFLRGLIRPTLTTYLVGMTTWITWMAWTIMKKEGIELTGSEALEIFNNVTSIVIYLTVSCTTWWFGDRAIAKSIMRIQKNKNVKTEEGEVTI